MKNKTRCGKDGIDITTIKNNIDVYVPLLNIIFVKSFSQGKLPEEFKTAGVVPVFKSRSTSYRLSSYRPISVINTIA